jgi:hypothetical protein
LNIAKTIADASSSYPIISDTSPSEVFNIFARPAPCKMNPIYIIIGVYKGSINIVDRITPEIAKYATEYINKLYLSCS